MQTKNLYTRWYRVVMYLGLGVLLVAGIVASIVGFVLDSHQEDLLESDFVGACYAAGIQTGQDITARHADAFGMNYASSTMVTRSLSGCARAQETHSSKLGSTRRCLLVNSSIRSTALAPETVRRKACYVDAAIPFLGGLTMQVASQPAAALLKVG